MTISRQPVAMPELAAQLRALGVPEGGVLLVHTSFSRIGAVENGPLGLIGALQAVLGPTGTLKMGGPPVTITARSTIAVRTSTSWTGGWTTDDDNDTAPSAMAKLGLWLPEMS